MPVLTDPMDEPLYLDFAASTPPANEVVDSMLPWLRHAHANPHSDHWHGHRAARAVEDARSAVASLIGAQASDVVFTSGATEANNLALKGLLSPGGARRRLWVSEIEHKSLCEPARALAIDGVSVSRVPVDTCGRIDPAAFEDLLLSADATPGLVALTHGNNEIGTLQPIDALVPIAHRHGQVVHLDASQSAAWEPLDVEALPCDLVCLSSHKLYGPAGIGALYVAPHVRHELRPQLHGGGQEGGLRSGTVPAFLAVGFGTAARLVLQRQHGDRLRLQSISREFEFALREARVTFELMGDPVHRLPGHLSLRFPGIDADDLLGVLGPTLSASSGAACAGGELRASYVLRSLGLNERAAGEVVRLSFGRGTPEGLAGWVAQEVAHGIRRILERGG